MTSQISPPLQKPLSFRSIVEADQAFLCTLYGTTRASELAAVPWTDEQKQSFIEMQFNAQHTFYQEQFIDAKFDIVSQDDNDIGRLYVDKRKQEVRITDIALLPEYRGKGIGTALLRNVISDAESCELPVTIHVEKSNPAMALYKRLGFNKIEDQGVYDLMRREP